MQLTCIHVKIVKREVCSKVRSVSVSLQKIKSGTVTESTHSSGRHNLVPRGRVLFGQHHEFGLR